MGKPANELKAEAWVTVMYKDSSSDFGRTTLSPLPTPRQQPEYKQSPWRWLRTKKDLRVISKWPDECCPISTITEPPFPNWPPFPNFFLQPQSLRYSPILNYGIFLVAVANMCVIFLIFYMSKQLYMTLNTGFKMRDFAYYWTSRAFLATPALPNFMIYLNAVRYVKSQVSEY